MVINKMNEFIIPGKPQFDTNGHRIQAHAGAIFYENDTYYWYGENKEKTDGKGKVWTYGIRFYSSKDFYNWKDEGLVIPPDTTSKRSPLHPARKIDRPHILFNPNTGKYVCWLKEIEKAFHILTADRLLGPYTMIKPNFKPLGKVAGDFDLCRDDTSGKAYIFWASGRECVFVAELTDDYLGVTNRYRKICEGLYPPFNREGLAHLARNGKHYLLSSGMTGYIPNPSEVAVADDWLGEYRVQGNPHIDDASGASFNSQISYVFQHPTIDDFYVALADRWVVDYPVTPEKYEWLKRVIASNYNRKQYKSTMKEKLQLLRTPLMAKANTSIADYVWLPIIWRGDNLEIHWMDEWKLDCRAGIASPP
jgi:hypothetical protein